MGNGIDLSVVIPARDAQGTIASCLRSVTRCPKDALEMECIVVDGSGTDGTAAIVHRYMQRDSRIKLAAFENSGGSAGLKNRGISEAQGKYIFFLNACDRLCEDAWEYIVPAVGEEYADFTAFSHIKVHSGGKMKAAMYPMRGVASMQRRRAAKAVYSSPASDGCVGKLFKSGIINDNGIIFRENMPDIEEYLFVAEYFGRCESFMVTKAMIVYHAVRKD